MQFLMNNPWTCCSLYFRFYCPHRHKKFSKCNKKQRNPSKTHSPLVLTSVQFFSLKCLRMSTIVVKGKSGSHFYGHKRLFIARVELDYDKYCSRSEADLQFVGSKL